MRKNRRGRRKRRRWAWAWAYEGRRVVEEYRKKEEEQVVGAEAWTHEGHLVVVVLEGAMSLVECLVVLGGMGGWM
jgi:hypothetical protein